MKTLLKIGPIVFADYDYRPLFIITVDTTLAGSASNTIQLPIQGTGMVIDWGDGTTSTHTQAVTPAAANWVTKTYATGGIYSIKIGPQITRIYFNNDGDRHKLLFIDNWGLAAWSSMNNAFNGCSAMQGRWGDAPDLSGATSTFQAFRDCTAFNYPMGNWNMITLTSLSSMFINATAFNNGGSADINNWSIKTTSQVSMSNMFNGAAAFNQNIGSWNVSSVTTMSGMFSSAAAFNQNLGAWTLRLAGVNMATMLNNCGMNTANYSQTLIGWANYASSNSNTPSASTLGATGRTYHNTSYGSGTYTNAVAARAYLVGVSPNPAWTISGDAQV